MNWCDAVGHLHSSWDWRRDPAWIETERLKHDIRNYRREYPGAGLSAELFDRILGWKLRRQRARTEQHRAELIPQNIAVVTEAAFSLDHPQRDVLAALRLRVLSSMSGIGTGVASAIMALSFPDTYGVVDFRVWNVVFDQSKRFFTPVEYIKYLHELWACALRLDLEPQLVDFLAWSYWERRKEQANNEMQQTGGARRRPRRARRGMGASS